MPLAAAGAEAGLCLTRPRSGGAAYFTRTGRTPRRRGENIDKLKARIDAGPSSKDQVCMLRGKDIARIINEELGVKLSHNAAYATLHRLSYSCLAPRRRHEKQDLEAQKKFKDDFNPFL